MKRVTLIFFLQTAKYRFSSVAEAESIFLKINMHQGGIRVQSSVKRSCNGITRSFSLKNK